MSDLPMAQVNHPAHNVPNATEDHKGTVLSNMGSPIYNEFSYSDAAHNAKWDLDNAMEGGARDNSWANDPRNK